MPVKHIKPKLRQKEWQTVTETNVWIEGVDRDVSISLLLYFAQSVFNRFRTGFNPAENLMAQPH